MRRIAWLSVLFLITAASGMATGEGVLDSAEPTQPMDWCMPTEMCVLDHTGRTEAVFAFEVDADSEQGQFTYVDHAARYAGKRFSVTANLTEVSIDDYLPWSFSYYLRGHYQPNRGTAVPGGIFEGWFRWSAYSDAPGFVVIYLHDDGSGFSYMNQGQMSAGYLSHPDLDTSGPMVDLGTLGPSPAHFSSASGINNQGQVVGRSYTGFATAGFLWDRGRMVDLGTPPWGTPDFVRPTAINERGQIVGDLRTSDVPQSAFMYHEGEWTVIKSADAWWSRAVDINNRGQVLGYENLGSSSRLFIWEAGVTTYLELGLPPTAILVTPVDITEQGQVLGHFDDFSPGPGALPEMRSFIWDKGELTVILAPGGERTEAFEMNARGQVVGTYYTDESGWNVQAFVWEHGIMTDLPGLSGARSVATAINNRGIIVGAAQTGEGEMHAVQWKDGVAIDLGTLGGAESWGYAINERGQIAGWADTPFGRAHGFIWQEHNVRP